MQKSHVYDQQEVLKIENLSHKNKLRLSLPDRYKMMFSASRYRYIQNYRYAFWTITN